MSFTRMPNDGLRKKEQQMLRNAAVKEFASKLKRELKPEEDLPDRLRELIAELDSKLPPDDK
jgi:hypothetical protein